MISLDMILIDEKNQVNKFRDKLSEGFLIMIRNFKVDIVHIPVNDFQFIQPNMIHSRVNNNTILSDVVGCLYGIGDQESVGSKWKNRDIHILTAEKYEEGFYPYLFPPESGPYIVIVTTITVKKCRGEITFTTTTTIKTYVNLTMDNITSLIHKSATNFVHIKTIDSANKSNIPMEEAMFKNKITIIELLDSDWSYDIVP
ncbi:hypothetical protein H5410_022132 [Solanum commersonii]|uniref:Uncharacterized protein n=1 Tax=Solanum commersonii TaxID=4109 RepID=A0A9J5ZD20_SOLCO|nr:hypothetical protein H5410_022132 [Solanum commersonii]